MAQYQYAQIYSGEIRFYFSQGAEFIARAAAFLPHVDTKSSTTNLLKSSAGELALIAFLDDEGWEMLSAVASPQYRQGWGVMYVFRKPY